MTDVGINAFVISIHALLTESDVTSHRHRPIRHISIHALLTESDAGVCTSVGLLYISIHALLTESDCGPPTLPALRT